MSDRIGSCMKFSVYGAEEGIMALEATSRTFYYCIVSAVSQSVVHHIVKINGSFKTFLYLDWNIVLYMDIYIYDSNLYSIIFVRTLLV